MSLFIAPSLITPNPNEDEPSQDRRQFLGTCGGLTIIAPAIITGLVISSEAALAQGKAPPKKGKRRQVGSDARLKADIGKVGTHELGFGIYRFRYRWSDDQYVGVMAQEVLEVFPSAVIEAPNGYLAVDYDALGLAMLPWHEFERSSFSLKTIASM